MTLPELNVELLDRVMAQIESDPDHWNQAFWAQRETYHTECGTAYCCAGWTVKLARPDLRFIWQGLDADTVEDPATGLSGGVSDIARRLLGLTVSEADQLFEGDNTLADLQRIVREIKDERQRVTAAAASDAN